MTEIPEILIPQQKITERIAELGSEISAEYSGKELHCIVVLNGAIFFAADLMRNLSLPLTLDSLAVASYSGEKSTGKLTFRSSLKLPVKNRDILLIDDILDSGRTLKRVVDYLIEEGANSVRTCVLLDKNTQRATDGLEIADYRAFSIPDLFVVGYGLDRDENYRHLPDIAYFA